MSAGDARTASKARLLRQKRWLHRRLVARSGVKPVALVAGVLGLRRALLEGHNVDQVAARLARGWGNPEFAAAPELLAAVIREAAASKSAIVECGGGVTSVVLAAARKHLGAEVVTLEHDPQWARIVQRRLRALRLHHDGVLDRPLEDRGGYDWYAVGGADLPQRIGLVICDGPPASTRGGRSGVAELVDRIWPPDVVLLDDTHRDAESALVAQLEGLGYSSQRSSGSLARSFTRLVRYLPKVTAADVGHRSRGDSIHIVLVAPECAPGEGLGQRGHYNEKIGRLLAGRGHPVTVLHLGEPGDEQMVDGVRYVGIGVQLTERAPSFLKRRFDRPLRALEFGLRCRRLIRSLEPPHPLVHLEVNGGAGVLLQIAPRWPTTLFLKGHMPTVNRLKHRRGAGQAVTSLLELLTMRTARSLYAPSELVGRRYQRETRRRIRRIATPTDPSFGGGLEAASASVKPPGTSFTFFTGTLEELKGVYLLASAFAVVSAQLPDGTLTVIGQDLREHGRSVRDRMSELLGDAKGRTRFVDFLPRDELANEIRQADVVVLPSLFDNLPNVLLEALQHGSLVVGTTGSSIDEVITDGVTGLLCEPSTLALADAMVDAATRADAAEIRSNALTLASHFDPAVLLPVLEEHLYAVARSGTPRPNG